MAIAARACGIRPDRQAWTLGALIAAGMAAGFILSRSIGLPGFHESDWELSGIFSALLEAGFLGALATGFRKRVVIACGCPGPHDATPPNQREPNSQPAQRGQFWTGLDK